ncbi:aspartate aminotransferase family protein [Noviherbaspirillum denitrificans]|uniref:aspartate aminotransferase family protein n=1 Tax=Noviherbaspirillum denitrificans TaxID=1968433 RepID=UPI000B536F53|nr:diaminobutyrate--2-oxoglutarate transaminase family protein [Noviherbaspirillum denitrificans]
MSAAIAIASQAYTRPSIQTAVPGPLSSEQLALQRKEESGAVSYPRKLTIAIKAAQGSYVEDMDGNVFLDCLTGAGVMPLGHNHPRVIAAAKQQLDKLTQGLDFPTEVKTAFRQAQLSMLPEAIRDDMLVHFCGPTGSDAVEAALKLSKLYTCGDEVISFQGGYHGAGHGTMAVTGLREVKIHLGNLMPGVHFFPYSHCHDCPVGLKRDNCNTNCATYLEKSLRDPNSGLRRPAAVIMELVQGEGGVIPADLEFVRRVRAVTREFDIPLIIDEIQTGCGRTGTWFAFEQYGIEPDIVLAAKALSGMGSPVALMFYNKRMNVWKPGAHIGTFRGNQIAFAAGVETIRVVREDDVLGNVREVGAFLLDGLRKLADEFPLVSDARGRGFMLGLEVCDPLTRRPSPEIAKVVQKFALQKGLIVELGGRDDIVVRLLPPLTLSMDEATQALAILRSALGEAMQSVKTVRTVVERAAQAESIQP